MDAVQKCRFEWEEEEGEGEEHRTLNIEHSTSNIEQEGTKNGTGKLTYTTLAGDTIEYWANSKKIPHVNGEAFNLNPENTYDSPYLKMKHGTDTAVISYEGYEDLVLNFSPSKPKNK
jgi:hypothetical protein